jgi:hypothetical protein
MRIRDLEEPTACLADTFVCWLMRVAPLGVEPPHLWYLLQVAVAKSSVLLW